MAGPNLKDLLSRKLGDVKQPPHIPAGTWRLRSMVKPVFRKSREKQTPGYEFTLGLVSAMDDVDEVEFAEFSEFYVGNFSGVSKKVTFWITDGNLFMFTNFLKDVCGLSPDLGIEEALASTLNVEMLGVFKKQISERNGLPFTALDSSDLAPLGDVA